MTLEEKARAYDEALKQAKFYHGNCPSEPERKKLEKMFPVLCESEDEKIRKEIISALKFANDGGVYDKHITYLEKQKYDRMKPVYDNQDSFESALEKAWKDYNDSGARTVDGCEDDYVECAHAKGFREGYLFGLEKQKEEEGYEAIPVESTLEYKLGFKAGKESEKQKEQPTNEEMLRTLRTEYEKGVADTIAKYEQKEQKHPTLDDPDIYGDWDKDLLDEIHSWLGHLDGKYTSYTIDDIKLTARHFVEWQKQKEQKSIFPEGLGEVRWNPISVQKEQKPDSLIYDKDLDKAAREFYLSGGADSPVDSTGLVPIVRMAEFGATWMKERIEKEQKPEECIPDSVKFDEGFKTGREIGFCEGVESVKPVEWSEEDKTVVMSPYEAEFCQKFCGHTPDYYTPKGWKIIKNCYAEFKEIVMRELAGRSSEWSEEEYGRLFDIEHYLDGTLQLSPDRRIACIDFLKSLRHWKPSEEDIKMLEHIIGQYETGNKNSKVMGYLPRVEELSFLKNVLSKWKN